MITKTNIELTVTEEELKKFRKMDMKEIERNFGVSISTDDETYIEINADNTEFAKKAEEYIKEITG